jgi:hypothetical protein
MRITATLSVTITYEVEERAPAKTEIQDVLDRAYGKLQDDGDLNIDGGMIVMHTSEITFKE